jgi:DNA-binding PadR family transcriptional regulator
VKHSGALDLAVLGLLKERDMHGYELRKQLGARLGPLWQVSWGSLYPTLRRLARSGAVEGRSESRRAARAGKTARGTGRRKTVYSITPVGEELFTRLLEESAQAVDTEHFSLKVAFFRYLRPEERVDLLERRRAYLLDKLALFRSNLRADRGERIDAYALSLQSHDMAVTESDIEWIDELITQESAPNRRDRTLRSDGSRSRQPQVGHGLDA